MHRTDACLDIPKGIPAITKCSLSGNSALGSNPENLGTKCTAYAGIMWLGDNQRSAEYGDQKQFCEHRVRLCPSTVEAIYKYIKSYILRFILVEIFQTAA